MVRPQLLCVATLDERTHEVRRSRKGGAPSLARSLDAEADREVRLASADRSSDENIVSSYDPVAASEIGDLRRTESLGGAEAEFVERLHLRERCSVESLLDGTRPATRSRRRGPHASGPRRTSCPRALVEQGSRT